MLWLASKRYKNKPARDACHKHNIDVKYSDRVTISIVLFICMKRVQQNNEYLTVSPIVDQYQAYIYTIGGRRYANPVYNVQLDTMIETEQAVLSMSYL